MRRLAGLVRADGGATAAEFGLVLPLFVIFLIGTIDVGRFLWTYNRAEKATQMGVRYAAVTKMVPAGLASYDGTAHNIAQGDPIPDTVFGGAHCQSSGTAASCACNSGATCPSLGTADNDQFNRIVARMQLFYPEITAKNVLVNYDYSGIGYSGDPNGPNIVPLVTIKLTGMTFTPMLFQFFGGTVTLPSFSSALTVEDGTGTVAD